MQEGAAHGYPIPFPALADSVAILGRTGSGKSYAARGAVELLLAQGQRVCIVDPTGFRDCRASPLICVRAACSPMRRAP